MERSRHWSCAIWRARHAQGKNASYMYAVGCVCMYFKGEDTLLCVLKVCGGDVSGKMLLKLFSGRYFECWQSEKKKSKTDIYHSIGNFQTSVRDRNLYRRSLLMFVMCLKCDDVRILKKYIKSLSREKILLKKKNVLFK